MRTRRPSQWARAGCCAAGVLLTLTLSGCAGSQDASALGVAQTYAAALADGDGDAACAVLAPAVRSELEQATGSSCGRAVLEEGVVPEGDGDDVLVYGVSAQVRFVGDTVFLGRFHDGWRVTAAACSATARDVYDCSVKGS